MAPAAQARPPGARDGAGALPRSHPHLPLRPSGTLPAPASRCRGAGHGRRAPAAGSRRTRRDPLPVLDRRPLPARGNRLGGVLPPPQRTRGPTRRPRSRRSRACSRRRRRSAGAGARSCARAGTSARGSRAARSSTRRTSRRRTTSSRGGPHELRRRRQLRRLRAPRLRRERDPPDDRARRRGPDDDRRAPGRRRRGHRALRPGRDEAALPAGLRLGRAHGRDGPDRAAGGLRPRRHPHAGDGTGGEIRIDGKKIFITNGGAEVHLVLARDADTFDASLGTTNGLSLYLVPRTRPDGTRERRRRSRASSTSSESTARRRPPSPSDGRGRSSSARRARASARCSRS